MTTKTELTDKLAQLQTAKANAFKMDESERLIVELQLHQVELEMQNQELRETQQALEASRDRYADLYDFAPVGYLSLTGTGIIKELNLTAATLLGKPRQRLLEYPFNQFVAEVQRHDFFHHLRRCQAEGWARTELTLLSQNGPPHQVQLYSTPVQDQSYGSLCRTVMTDITDLKQAEDALRQSQVELEQRVQARTAELQTANATLQQEIQQRQQEIAERKAAEDALRESEARLRAIIHAVPDLLLVLDEDGRCLEILTTQPERLAIEPAALKGQRLSDVFPAEVAQVALNAIRQTLRTRRPQSFEYDWSLAKADRRFFEARTAPLTGLRLDPSAVVMLARDITQHRLTEESLRQAQKIEAVGQLTGGIAHDFNNLLAIVLGNLDLLAEALDRSELQALVQRALEAAERGATLIQRLLTFARRQPLQAQPVELNRLVVGMTDLLQRTLGETIQVETRLAGDLAQVVIDASQFETALLNLALNACDAMPSGGQLTIGTANVWLDKTYSAMQQSVPPGQYVLLTVSDTGMGMPPSVAEHAFEPFFTTKGIGKGSGLGLSMVYGLVKQLGGSIQLDSEVGRGTVIKIYLPPWKAGISQVPEARLQEVPLPAGQGQTILVVEDETAVRRLAVHMLQRLGYQTVEAETAAAALQALEVMSQIQLLFTDVVLPGGMSGIELAQAARQRRPALPVLITSGYSNDHRAFSHSQEGLGWLSKPYRQSQLAIKLSAMLGSASDEF